MVPAEREAWLDRKAEEMGRALLMEMVQHGTHTTLDTLSSLSPFEAAYVAIAAFAVFETLSQSEEYLAIAAAADVDLKSLDAELVQALQLRALRP